MGRPGGARRSKGGRGRRIGWWPWMCTSCGRAGRGAVTSVWGARGPAGAGGGGAKRQYGGGQLREVVEEPRWIWVTDLSSEGVPARLIQQWGHDRWDLENRGFNELTMLWHMDHCFTHQPRAIEAVLLTLTTAFLLTYLFYGRNLKPVARRHLTRLALAARLLEGFALSGASLWPEVQRSD